mmetsp:Transcript_31359/g.30714  ORF Transcript_31359/g.30714 Transcript_31359/m.30714 type:complete len:110 (-) Transcript_31359:387-716(-)
MKSLVLQGQELIRSETGTPTNRMKVVSVVSVFVHGKEGIQRMVLRSRIVLQILDYFLPEHGFEGSQYFSLIILLKHVLKFSNLFAFFGTRHLLFAIDLEGDDVWHPFQA